jgi:hypothetical protein
MQVVGAHVLNPHLPEFKERAPIRLALKVGRLCGHSGRTVPVRHTGRLRQKVNKAL